MNTRIMDRGMTKDVSRMNLLLLQSVSYNFSILSAWVVFDTLHICVRHLPSGCLVAGSVLESVGLPVELSVLTGVGVPVVGAVGDTLLSYYNVSVSITG